MGNRFMERFAETCTAQWWTVGTGGGHDAIAVQCADGRVALITEEDDMAAPTDPAKGVVIGLYACAAAVEDFMGEPDCWTNASGATDAAWAIVEANLAAGHEGWDGQELTWYAGQGRAEDAVHPGLSVHRSTLMLLSDAVIGDLAFHHPTRWDVAAEVAERADSAAADYAAEAAYVRALR